MRSEFGLSMQHVRDFHEADYVKVFRGKQFGIGLRKRGDERNDGNHVCFDILSEDDDNWFINTNEASSSWIEDLQVVLEEAYTWVKANCEPDVVGDIQYGYYFK